MNISLDLVTAGAVANGQPVSNEKTAPPSKTIAEPAPSKAREAAPPVPPVIGSQEANITFRRDSNGRVFYVVSDAQSGKEIRELPTQSVRSVGDGIAELLKKEESQAGPHLNVKG